MEISDLVVIGAGMAGLTVACGARAAGLSVRVLDKGRGVGGRLATRRAEGGLRFDHGAQVLPPRDPAFAALLRAAEAAGAAARWDRAGGGMIGVPGMSGLARHLAEDLDVRTGCRVERLKRAGVAWDVIDATGYCAMRGRGVVLAIPAPQVAPLLMADHPLTQVAADVVFAPCWTLMAAFDGPAELPETHRDDAPDAVLSWVAHDGAKPGRDGGATYVAQASPAWSRCHLEHDGDGVQARMLGALADVARWPLPPLRHAAVHRWRYATVETPLGRPCVAYGGEGLYACGDWCLGDKAEHAWASGRAVLSALGIEQPAHDAPGG